MHRGEKDCADAPRRSAGEDRRPCETRKHFDRDDHSLFGRPRSFMSRAGHAVNAGAWISQLARRTSNETSSGKSRAGRHTALSRGIWEGTQCGICSPTACDSSSHTRPSSDFLIVCLAAHDSKFRRWTAENVKLLLPPRQAGGTPSRSR
jgi:hypothetical protein